MTIQPFVHLSGVAAPLMEDNVDTDIIFPARFLLITARAGLGRYAFNDRRYTADGAEQPGFVLNQPGFRHAAILIAGANFGCGSSREQAVWALLGFGICCIVAPSFGEIFHGNCLRNGVLPIVLSPDLVTRLASDAAAGKALSIDLPATTVTVEGDLPIRFAIPAEQKNALLNGWDETALILNDFADRIAAFEHGQRAAQPWLYPSKPT